jgi:mannitol-1-phosphate/altronate dehydrogenase
MVNRYYKNNNAVPKNILFSLSALIYQYYVNPSNDSDKVIAIFASAKNSDNFVKNILKNSELWGQNLCDLNGLEQIVTNYYNYIKNSSTKEALEKLLNE